MFMGGKRLASEGGKAHVIRAVSTSGPAGPYTYAEEVEPRDPSRLGNGMGLRADAHYTPEGAAVLFTVAGLDGKYGFVGLVNEDGNPEGPWEPFLSYHYQKNSSAVWDFGFVDPTATIRPDGSILVAYRTDMSYDGHEHVGLLHADNWRSPLQKVTTDATGPLFTFNVSNEDPFIWWSDRGTHMLFHAQEGSQGPYQDRKYRGSYAFAPGDGRNIGAWRLSQDRAWPEEVQWSNGSSSVALRRQRPSLLFPAGHAPELGAAQSPRPTHLVTGANFFDGEWTKTDRNSMLIQAIDYSSEVMV